MILLPFLHLLFSLTAGQIQGRIPHTFIYRTTESGHHVNLAGDFNSWSKTATPMSADSAGRTFRITVPLAFGKHAYKFVVDGETWILDPANPKTIADNDGNKNSLLVVLPPDFDQPARKGDGVIAVSALRHDPQGSGVTYDPEFSSLALHLQTRANDVADAAILVGQKRIPMKELAADDLFATYGGSLKWEKKADLDYVFELKDGGKPIYFGPKGVSPSPEGNRFHLEAKSFKVLRVPDWVEHTVIYQIFPDRFANGDPSNDGPNVQPWGGQPTFSNRFGGDVAGVRQHIDYLKSLGIGCIYFNPIFKSPANHGYETTDYLQVDPRFGTNQELADAVSDLKKNGIRTVLDGVFNHTSREFFAFKDVVDKGAASKYTDWYFFHGFPVRLQGPPNYEGWFGFGALPKLNNKNPEVRKYLLNVPDFWAKQMPLAGWRLDVPNEVPDDFWPLFRARVKAANPDAWIVGEIWGDASHWLQGDMFDSTMNYRFRASVLDFLAPSGSGKPSELWNSLMATYNLYAPQVNRNLMNLVDSHDTERLLTEVGHDRKLADLAAILQFTWIGTPCIYYGDELGLDGGKDPDNRRCMPWELVKESNPTLALYRALIKLRKSCPALQLAKPEPLVASDASGLFAFTRTLPGRSAAIIVINRSSQTRALNLERALKGRNWRDGLTGHSLSSPQLELEAESARVLVSP
jgi:glycosidase